MPADDPLQLKASDLEIDLAVNITGAFVAAQKAVEGFGSLDLSSPKNFIYTGNALNTQVMPALISLGIGKSAGAHLIAAASKAYAPRGYK